MQNGKIRREELTTDSGINKITNYPMMFWFQLQCLISNHISVFNSNSVNKKISQNRFNSFSFFLQIYDSRVRALNITTFNKYFSVDKIVGQMKIFKKSQSHGRQILLLVCSDLSLSTNDPKSGSEEYFASRPTPPSRIQCGHYDKNIVISSPSWRVNSM